MYVAGNRSFRLRAEGLSALSYMHADISGHLSEWHDAQLLTLMDKFKKERLQKEAEGLDHDW